MVFITFLMVSNYMKVITKTANVMAMVLNTLMMVGTNMVSDYMKVITKTALVMAMVLNTI